VEGANIPSIRGSLETNEVKQKLMRHASLLLD
jgi:hypothetical protein